MKFSPLSKNISLKTLLFSAIMLFSGCVTEVGHFESIYPFTKKVGDTYIADKEIKGSDSGNLIFFWFPVNRPNLKDAVYNAIKNESGCIGIADVRIKEFQLGLPVPFIPFHLWRLTTYRVEGKPIYAQTKKPDPNIEYRINPEKHINPVLSSPSSYTPKVVWTKIETAPRIPESLSVEDAFFAVLAAVDPEINMKTRNLYGTAVEIEQSIKSNAVAKTGLFRSRVIGDEKKIEITGYPSPPVTDDEPSIFTITYSVRKPFLECATSHGERTTDIRLVEGVKLINRQIEQNFRTLVKHYAIEGLKDGANRKAPLPKK